MNENNVLGHFFFNYKHILIDEIALDGLEGIGLDLLWRRVEQRISTPLTDKMKIRFWASILDCKEIIIYQLPEPLPHVEIHDRFLLVDEETGDLKDPDDYLDGPYEYSPVTNEYGSCKYFTTRKLIPSQQLMAVPYQKVLAEYGQTLVMVASIEERWKALAKHQPITCLQQMMPLQYCILELIGKGRANGQMTVGKTNLTKIVNMPKNLFYNRRCLYNLDLIKVLCVTQSIASRGVKSLLLRLNRFHKPVVLSMPRTGKVYNILEYLKTCPKYAASSEDLLNLGIYSRLDAKRIRKNNNIFDFVERYVENTEPPKKRYKSNPPSLMKKRRFLCLVSKSDESSQSEEEVTEEPVKYQYKVGVGLLRQAYERFLDAKLKGISMTELAQMLGIEFYTTRLLCRVLKGKKLVREYYEDKGKQRITRYVAVAAGHSDAKYAEERNKFMKYITQNNDIKSETSVTPSTSGEAHAKVPGENADELTEVENAHISIVTPSEEDKIAFKSLVESGKSLTLRQLKFGNGVLKIVKEKQCITGYQTLSNLVAKEINEPPMVTKALKSFLEKLIVAGQVKMYRIKWPGNNKHVNYINLICAPHIKATDPIIRAKYKELHVRATAKKVPPKKETQEHVCRPLSMLINPRYMKIQKLHEMIMKNAFFEPPPDQTNSPGFLSMADLMPEMTVKFAISNMSITGLAEISDLRIYDNHLNMKLKDAPVDITHGIIKCKSLKNALRLNLKALAMHGLIQLIYIPEIQTANYAYNTLISFIFYVNRNARIVNTSGIWPREANIQDLERSYYFDTFEDVKQFWRDVYDISVDTKIAIKEARSKKTLSPPIRRENEVQNYDNGDRYGDGRGPCGFDSCFYMEIARLWRTYYVRDRPKPIPPKIKPQVKIPKITKNKKQRAPSKRKVPRKVNPVMKLKVVTKGRKRVPETTVTWTKREDIVIMLCQTAITIASPSSQPGCLRIRNIVAKDILSLSDEKKTQSVCHRRSMMLSLNPNIMHEKESLLNEMRRRRGLIQKYEGFLKKLRLRHATNMSKFMNEARLPMLELVWLIWQVSKSESYNRRLPCVAMNVHDFHEHFTIEPATANKFYNMYKAPEYAILREAVFLTIMLTLHGEVKSHTAKRIYSIFKVYPENTLRIVIDQLRRCGAVSAKEKLLNNQMHRLHLEDIVSSAYKVSVNYQRRWIGRLNSDFTDSLAKLIDSDLPISNIKGSAEMNCVICELQGLGVIEVVTEIKPDIVNSSGVKPTKETLSVSDIEGGHKLNSGTVSWIRNPDCDAVRDSMCMAKLYQNIDYEYIVKYLERNAVVNITIDEDYEMEDVIIKHLESKGDKGASFKELQETTKIESHHLIQRLTDLENKDLVRRVGLFDNTLVLIKYIQSWAIKIENKYIIVTPWLTLDCGLRCDILLEWAGVIVNKIFECPGCSITYLSESFELITGRALQDACVFLEYFNCVKLQTVTYKEPDLFSDTEAATEIIEFNPYASMDNILVFPLRNMVTKYIYVRKMLLEMYLKNKCT